jgi:predicted nuclease of predicted toxin-antitoxin system
MVALYMDVHVKQAITRGLRRRGVDVLTAQEDGTATLGDALLLDRAAALNRLIFTQDDDFLAEANRRQINGEYFVGVIYIHQRNTTVGQCIDDLETVAYASDLEEYASQVRYLPL